MPRRTFSAEFNRKFVGEMLEALELPSDYVEQVKALNKVINEQDVSRLHVVRIIVELARLLRRTKGVFKVTRKGKELLAEDQAGVLYALLFRTYFRKFNLGYSDRLPELPEIQNAIAFSLFMASVMLAEWQSVHDIASSLFLPEVLREIPVSPHINHTPYLAYHRGLRPLAQFGLLEERREWEESAGRGLPQMRKTELFERFLSFGFGPHLRLV